MAGSETAGEVLVRLANGTANGLAPELEVGISDFGGGAFFEDFAVLNEDGAVTELADVFHGVGD